MVVLLSSSNLLALFAAWDTWSRNLRASSTNTPRSFSVGVDCSSTLPGLINYFLLLCRRWKTAFVHIKIHLLLVRSLQTDFTRLSLSWDLFAARYNPVPLGCFGTPLCHRQICLLCFGPRQGGRLCKIRIISVQRHRREGCHLILPAMVTDYCWQRLDGYA